jgi:hypothetical protein
MSLLICSAFEEFIKDKESKHYKSRKNERLRVERKRRLNFTNFVEELLMVNGTSPRKLTHLTPWQEFVKEHNDNSVY